MHDPQVVVFDLHVPIPTKLWSLPGPRYGIKRERYTCNAWENPLCGKPIYVWWRPAAWRMTVAGQRIGMLEVATVWHNEPDGHDSGTVCKGMYSSELSFNNVKWALKHRKHCHVQWLHYQRAKRWLFERCDACGKPFRGGYRSVHGYMGSDEKYHEHCMTILTLQEQIGIFKRYINLGADAWQARYLASR